MGKKAVKIKGKKQGVRLKGKETGGVSTDKGAGQVRKEGEADQRCRRETNSLCSHVCPVKWI